MIRALWFTTVSFLRQTFRYKFRIFIWSLNSALWGLLFILPIALFAPQDKSLADISTFIFLGFIFFLTLSMSLWEVGFELRRQMMRGTLESMLATGHGPWLIVTGKLLHSLAYFVLDFLVFYAIISAMITPPQLALNNALALLIGIVGYMILLWGHAALMGSMIMVTGTSGPLFEIVNWIIPFATGMFAPPALLPEGMRAVALWTPFAHPCELIRASVTNAPTLLPVNALYVTALLAPLAYAALGFAALAYAHRKARREGLKTPGMF